MKTIKRLLKQELAETEYEIIFHDKPILSVSDARRYFDVDKAAPVLIFETDKGFYALIKSMAMKRANLHTLKEVIGCNEIKLAEQESVLKATGYHVGEVPLVGLRIPYIFDNALTRHEFIYGGTGNACYTLKIRPEALIKINLITLFTGQT